MGDVPLIIGIAVFWLLLGFSLGAIASDSTLISIESGNTSSIYNSPTSSNYSDSSLNEQTTSTSILGEFFRMFTFSIGENANFPQTLQTIISIINYILLFTLVLLVYRQIRSGAG